MDLPGGDGGPLVVVSQTGSFSGDAFENIVDERVHDTHGLGGDTGIGVDLFQDFVDIDGVRLPAFLAPLLVALSDSFGGLAGLLGSLSGNFWWHVEVLAVTVKLIVLPCLGFNFI